MTAPLPVGRRRPYGAGVVHDDSTGRSRLSREAVIEAALRIVDAHGAGALSMRAVAAEVGSPVMSLYRHVGSREDLEDGIVALLTGGIGPLPQDVPWDVGLRAWANAYREMVRAHPNAVSMLGARPLPSYQAQRGTAERGLRMLQDAGATPEDARFHLRVALVTIVGFCHQQAEANRPAPPGAAEALTGAGFPLLAGLVGRLGEDGDELFATMLDMVIEGIAARLVPRG